MPSENRVIFQGLDLQVQSFFRVRHGFWVLASFHTVRIQYQRFGQVDKGATELSVCASGSFTSVAAAMMIMGKR